MVYQPKPADVKTFTMGQSDGGLFKPLPGLKVLDPKLMNQPQFQKIIQTQNDPSEEGKGDSQPAKKD